MLNILHYRTDRSIQKGFALTVVLVAIIVVALIGGTGVYLWHKDHKPSNRTTPVQQTTPQAANSKSALTMDSYAGWKTYVSSFEKLSFRYPSNWSVTSSSGRFGITGADSFQLTSPSGSVAVSWYSAVQGLGGACDNTIMPGTTAASPGSLSPCPYWYVLDKQKLSGADLYYVDGVTTNNGTTYSPWCALQAPDGVLTNESNIGYMLFKGKNNDFVQNGHNLGLQQAGLLCSKSNFGGVESMTGTKEQATAYLSSSAMQQAKLILLSASY